jgi:hypothetical protein
MKPVAAPRRRTKGLLERAIPSFCAWGPVAARVVITDSGVDP